MNAEFSKLEDESHFMTDLNVEGLHISFRRT